MEHKKKRMVSARERAGGSNLFTLAFKPLKDSLEGAILEATVFPGSLIVLISLAQPLGPEVECVAKGLVHAGKHICAGHENLEMLL